LTTVGAGAASTPTEGIGTEDRMTLPHYKIAIVGEAWGEYEERERSPFVGPAGWQLNTMLRDAGIARTECHLTNVFNLRPKPSNKIDNLCGTRKEVLHALPPLSSGKYVLDKYLPEVERLRKELTEVNPNVIICAGGTAAWALLSDGRISKLRGAVAPSTLIPGKKCLPTFHPSYILQGGYEARHVTILDLKKARRESEFPDIRRPLRTVYTEPLLIELDWFYDKFVAPARRLAVDIETRGDRITCIGFAPAANVALVVPFEDIRKPGGNYWRTVTDEVAAMQWVRHVLDAPCEKIFQNGLFDISRLWRTYGIPVRNAVHDTMLLHHALQPESPKGLDYLGSIYTDEAAWKLGIRLKHKTTIKRED
jgi:DNA polymerase